MEPEPLTTTEARALLLRLVSEGWLIGVHVFGSYECCAHGPVGNDGPFCESMGFGLCDQFAFNRSADPADPNYTGVIAGSDCNRAEPYIMRPHDRLMEPELRALLADQPD